MHGADLTQPVAASRSRTSPIAWSCSTWSSPNTSVGRSTGSAARSAAWNSRSHSSRGRAAKAAGASTRAAWYSASSSGTDGLDARDLAHVLADAEDVERPLEAAGAPGVDDDPLAVGALEQVGDDAAPTEAEVGPRPGEVGDVALVPPPVHRAQGEDPVEQRRVDALAHVRSPGGRGARRGRRSPRASRSRRSCSDDRGSAGATSGRPVRPSRRGGLRPGRRPARRPARASRRRTPIPARGRGGASGQRCRRCPSGRRPPRPANRSARRRARATLRRRRRTRRPGPACFGPRPRPRRRPAPAAASRPSRRSRRTPSPRASRPRSRRRRRSGGARVVPTRSAVSPPRRRRAPERRAGDGTAPRRCGA